MRDPRKTIVPRACYRDITRNDGYVSDVMVLGGGISGIQASLDLANSGFKVLLIDRAPTIGGHMAQLDKVFPTNDCSMCIESPKLIECNRHPNIDILTCSEVEALQGEAGAFEVSLFRRPRYVLEDRCRGCGACSQYCPVSVPNPFNENLSLTKAVRLHFPQAAPLAAHVDPEACLFLIENKCAICAGVCKHKAIDLNQKERRLRVQTGAVILAPGYETFDPAQSSDYGYGRLPNVVTSLEFERILNADGPYHGELARPSDGKPPKRIAWIQCVGSRGFAGGADYCSAVCCMYAMKQMILARERVDDIETTLFHNDIRACGKEFEQFYQRAKDLPGARFIRSYVSLGAGFSGNDGLSIRYAIGGTVNEEQFDMAVLSVGLRPPKGAVELSRKLCVELDPHGFCKTADAIPLQTSRPGIFACGAFLGPMDIPGSVITGSAAAALCGRLLSRRRGRLTRNKEYPPERDVSAEEPRVGVFVCHCGANIGSVVDVKSVTEYSTSLDNVIHAEELLFACSADATVQIAERIREKSLNRVVVAACTPRTHEPLFQETLREAGINKYCFVMANIREHSSWVHSREKARATQKAKDKVRMSVRRAVNLGSLKELELPVTSKGLVVGGGLAGMTSALSLADSGFEVYLVERSRELGGATGGIGRTLEGMDLQAHLAGLRRRIYENPLVHVLTDSRVMKSSGYVGNFTTQVADGCSVREIRHGATIIATGAEQHKPAEYLYGKDGRVVTLVELDEKIAEGNEDVLNAESMAVILCVGSREENRPHCSRTCCSQAMNSVLQLKQLNPGIEIYVLYRDMRTFGFNEDFYRQAASRGVKFIRYEPDDKPKVEAATADGRDILRVSVFDPVLEKRIALDTDFVVLAPAVVPSSDNKEISRLFKAPLSRDGFFLEAHMKLRPVDFATEGVFVCGSAHFPKTLEETIAQAYAAAGRAATILSRKSIVSSGAVCDVDETLCIGCGLCRKVCQFAAVELVETADGKKSSVTSAACQGCGACNSICPTGAISLRHFTDEQILAEIYSAAPASRKGTAFEPRILAFLCNWCGYAGADMAGVSRIQYAPTAREVRVMCSSRVHPKFIFEAFLRGIDGVLVCGCHLGDCHYIKANENTEATIKATQERLRKLGISPERLRHEYISAAEGVRYAEKVDDFTGLLAKLGPLELSEEQRQGLVAFKPASASRQDV